MMILKKILVSYKLQRNKFLYSTTKEKNQQEEINKNIKNNNNSEWKS